MTKVLACSAAAFLLAFGLKAQDGKPAEELPAAPVYRESKHIMGVIPNYKTMPDRFAPYEPLSAKGKFKIATQDSFDPAAFFIAGMFSGIGQLNDSNPSWGLGAKGYGKRYAAAFADQAISNYLTEAILPSALHQDPRYFRLGRGSAWKRTTYAISRVIVNRNDSGKDGLNVSELLGSGIGAAISAAYYPEESRHFGDTMQKFTFQVVADSGYNVLKEFWPDIQRKLFHKNIPAPPR